MVQFFSGLVSLLICYAQRLVCLWVSWLRAAVSLLRAAVSLLRAAVSGFPLEASHRHACPTPQFVRIGN